MVEEDAMVVVLDNGSGMVKLVSPVRKLLSACSPPPSVAPEPA